VDFIASKLPSDNGNDSLCALADGPYAAAAEFDAVRLNERARAWVEHYG
jgi:hypothetical protein